MTADELGERAAAAGVTRSATPRNAVMSAMRGREVALSEDRWVTPLWLLEGRCLTTSAMSVEDGLYDISPEDLGLLHLAAALLPLPLRGGGFLRRYGWRDQWKATHALPALRPDEVMCFRVTGGELEISPVPTTALAPVEPSFVDALNRSTEQRTWSYSWDAGTAVVRRLAEQLLADDALLRSPIPPLSTFVDAFAQQAKARAYREEIRYFDEWETVDTAVRLSPWHAQELADIADAADLLPHEWVERQIDVHRRTAVPRILRMLP